MKKRLNQITWTLLILTWSLVVSGYDILEHSKNYMFSNGANFAMGATAALIVQVTAGIITYRVSLRNKSEEPYRNVLIVNGFILFCLVVKYFVAPMLF